MTKKCSGCGDVLNSNKELCERCFRIKNYNEYQTIIKSNDEFLNIIKEINKTKSLVVLVLDLLHLPENLDLIKKNLTNDLLIVLTKRDLLPKSINNNKLLNFVDRYNIKYVDKLIISSVKNYNFDELLSAINKYRKEENIYVVGFTNAGKSTMINQLIYNYSSNKTSITTSMLPSTTLGTIDIKLHDDLTIIDTPGLLDDGNIINFLPNEFLKKLNPKKEINPITYQIKHKQIILVEDFLEIECKNNNNLSFYMSNQLNVKREYENQSSLLVDHVLKVSQQSDIVIPGVGFIKVGNDDTIIVRTILGVNVFVRKSLI